MPITLDESGALGYYWYESRSDAIYIESAVVGATSPFNFRSSSGADPAANCGLAFVYKEFDPGDQKQDTIIAQGPEWVKYVCAPPCQPESPPVCICCVGPPFVHAVKSPDVESERMFHMLWDTSDHGRWCRTGGAYCPDGKSYLDIETTSITTDADDEEIHIVGTNGNDISASAICIKYSGGSPEPTQEPRQHLIVGDVLGGQAITKIYHYSKWNDVQQEAQSGSVLSNSLEDMNFHYVELAAPLTNQTYLANLSNSINPNVQIVAGGGVKDKAIVFGRFEFLEKEIFYSKLKVNPALYSTKPNREVANVYPIAQQDLSRTTKLKASSRLQKLTSSQQSSFVQLGQGMQKYAGMMTSALDTEVNGFVDLKRNDSPERLQDERYLKIYEPQGKYKNNSEGNEGEIKETIITIDAVDNSTLTGLSLSSPGAGYTNDVEIGISSPTGRDAAGVVLGSAPLTSITVDTEGDGYQQTPAAEITPSFNTWAANTNAALNASVVSGNNVYQVTLAGDFGATEPTHTTGVELNGTAKLLYRGILPTFNLDLVGTTRTEYVEITKQGSGYTSVPAITFNVGTQTAVATFDVDRITAITVTPGDEATSNPLITIGSPWVGTQAYTIGDQVFVSNNLYTAASNGTSGTVAPSHSTGTISDGGVDWTYAGEAAKAISKNYDGKITAVTIVDAGARVSESVTFNVSLPTSPYIAGTQLQITPIAGAFELDVAVLTSKGYGYSQSNTTFELFPQSGTTSLAVVEGVFTEDVLNVISVGHQFRKKTDRTLSGTIQQINTAGTQFISRDVSRTPEVGDILFFGVTKTTARITSVRTVASPKTLAKVDTVQTEPYTVQQINAYVDGQDKRLVDEAKFQDPNNDEPNFLGAPGSSKSINDLTQGNINENQIGTLLIASETQRTNDNLLAKTFNDDPENKVRIFDLANEKVKKYGPVNRWRDIPRSTSELKIMPVKWVPDEREVIKRAFTITCTFTPQTTCDFGPRPLFTQLPSINNPGSGGNPEDPGYVAPSSFIPPLGCGQPCCPPQPNNPMEWTYTKYFVNNFSNAAARWGNVIKTYNDHPTNANWSFL